MKHKFRHRILLVAAVLAVMAAGCGRNNKTQDQKDETACTLKEAWAIALDEVQKWSDDAQAILITSTDNHDKEDALNGIDGKRLCWNFMFHSAKKDKQYSIYVISGKPAYGQEASTPYYKTTKIDEFLMDSDDLYRIAVEQKLEGGIDWAYGYHYVLQYRYMNGSENEPQLTLSIRGIDDEGNEKYIVVDPYTGDILSSIMKSGYDENGRAIWEEEDGKSLTDSSDSTDNNEEKQHSNMSREEIEEEFEVFENAVKYKMDPKELTDAIIEGLSGSRFSPFSECWEYEEEEWRERMRAYYGDDWEKKLNDEKDSH